MRRQHSGPRKADPLEIRARELAVAAGIDPDSRIAKAGSERGMPAWCGFREAARDGKRITNVTSTSIPIKLWTEGVPVEEEAIQQLKNMAQLPFVFHHIAVMPDVHVGKGATVGSVIATKGAIVPAAVGVDIGCVDAETEYLSPTGWKKIANYQGGHIMQYHPEDGTGTFVTPTNFIKEQCTEFLWFHTKYGVNQMLSYEHRVLCWEIKGRDRHREMTVMSAIDLAEKHNRLVLGAKVEFETTFTPILESSLPLSDAELRVQIMVNADGHLDERSTKFAERTAVLKFHKNRKIERCRELLNAAGISYTENSDGNENRIFRFRSPFPSKKFSSFWAASLKQLEIIADECLNWDGNIERRCFYTRIRESADFIQYAFTATGTRAVLRFDEDDEGEIDYRVFSNLNTMVGIAGVPKTPVERVPSEDGFKYCFRVPSGFWVMRRGGNIVMTGNCGMAALMTNLTANDLPDSLTAIRSELEACIPVGNASHKAVPKNAEKRWYKTLKTSYEQIENKHPKFAPKASPANQLGTLGGGNHFIELCLDETDTVWLMLHSGSRGIGNRIGSFFITAAKQEMEKLGINLPDRDLSYLTEGSVLFDDYVEAVGWAQDYAMQNRQTMVDNVLLTLGKFFPQLVTDQIVVQCHHNYVERETHFGEQVWVTRKGAVRARQGDMGIIPGSMGARSYITRGKGNPDSFNSSAHGAGRRMSRTEAKRQFTLDDHIQATVGVNCRKDSGVIDETPGAYKNIDNVMQAQTDLVDIAYTLKQVLCIKG